MYNSQVGLYFLMTSNVINTVSDASMAVSTVALPIPAASSIATETREVSNRTRTDSCIVCQNVMKLCMYTFHPEVGCN